MTKNYNNTINVLRGVLICLVILVHIDHFEVLHSPIQHAILAFLMPTFLVITGYLANINKPIKAFMGYVGQLFLAYFFMMLELGSRHMLSLGTDLEVGHFVERVLMYPIGLCWFLHCMIVCSLLYYATFRSCTRKSKEVQLLCFGTAILAVSLFTPLLNFKSAAYFFIGAAIKQQGMDFSRLYLRSSWPIIPLVLLLAQPEYYDWGSLTVPAMVFCFMSIISHWSRLFPQRITSIIAYIGRNTLPIYIFHLLFTHLGKYFLPWFSFDPTGITHAVVVVFLGIGGSLTIAKGLDMLHLSYAFGRKAFLR